MPTAKSTSKSKAKPASRPGSKPGGKPASKPATVAEYLAGLPADHRATINAARKFVHAHIPEGYAEFMSWGVINWGIPLSRYPNTYNGHPLCYVALGAHKNYSTLHLMGCYGAARQTAYLKEEYKKAGKKFDMGKACLHFRTMDDLVPDAVGRVIASVTPETFLENYEKVKKLQKS
jgi:Domain of unknown function (DU1801)